MLVSRLGRGRLEGECRGQLSWEPPVRQLGAGQSWREEFCAGEMSLWEAGEVVGAVLLHECTGAGGWSRLRPFLLLHLPQAACASRGPWLSPAPSVLISVSCLHVSLPAREQDSAHYFLSSHPPFPASGCPWAPSLLYFIQQSLLPGVEGGRELGIPSPALPPCYVPSPPWPGCPLLLSMVCGSDF